MTGFWTVEERAGNDGQKDVYFGVLQKGCPTDQQHLKDEIERTLSALRTIYGAGPKFNEAFAKLLALAQVGLVGATPATPTAQAALASLQAEVVDREAGRVKNGYMLKLGLWALGFAMLSAAAFFVLAANPCWPPEQIYRYRYFFLLWSGCMAGAWASFASRKALLGFFDLAVVEEDRIEPALRLLFTGVLTVLLAFVFTTGLANVIVGSFQASNIIRSGSTAILAGGFAGLAEKALPAAMLQRAQDFIAASAGRMGK
jgi:hypothetical protein